MAFITGRLENIERLESSRNGNPRFAATVNGVDVRTSPDSSFGYSIQNHEGKLITVEIREYYGNTTIENIQKVLC